MRPHSRPVAAGENRDQPRNLSRSHGGHGERDLRVIRATVRGPLAGLSRPNKHRPCNPCADLLVHLRKKNENNAPAGANSFELFLARSANKFVPTFCCRYFRPALLAALWLALGLSGPLHADPVPLDDNLQAVGSGHLSWWGIGVYDATLYSDDGRYRPQRPHALRIDYQISVTASKLAERSLDEIEEIFGEQPERQRMIASLQTLFCDVEDGDTIIGYHYPGEGAEFYCNDQRMGRLDDSKLAAAFFAIWLDPRTSEPELRRQLLGESS
jgi:hypothetical protein